MGTTLAKLVAQIEAEGAEVTIRSIRDVGKEGEKTGDKVEDANKKSSSSFKSLTKTVLGYAAAFVSVKSVARFILESIEVNKEFSASISELSAITGAVGEDLKFLSDQSKLYGQTTTFSATQAATAFKLVASAKPDLLGNRDALAQVTQEALTLAEAAGTTLPESAATLGSALNQFGADAEEAGRFINVLAAGSKLGASEVTDTAAALKESGTVAAASGVSFENLNAAIQTLSTVSIKGGQAGTQLRNIILKLQQQTQEGFNPAVVGLNQALANLKASNLSNTELMKLFGLESVTAAQALINQSDSVAVLTDNLTGTNIAYEQASVRMDNLQGDTKALESALEGLSIQTGEKLNPAMRNIVQTATQLTLAWSQTVSEFDKGAVELNFVTETMKTISLAVKILQGAFKIAGDTIGASVAVIINSMQAAVRIAQQIIDRDFKGVLNTFQGSIIDGNKSILEGVQENAAAVGQEILFFESKLASIETTINKQKELTEAVKETKQAQLVDVVSPEGQVFETGGEVKTKEERLADRLAKEEQRLLDSNQRKLLSLKEFLGHERDILLFEQEERLDALDELEQAGLISKEERMMMELELTARHQKALSSIEKKGITDRASFAKATSLQQAGFIFGQLAAVTQGVSNQSKKLFKINQAATLAQIAVEAPGAIASAIKNAGGLPFGAWAGIMTAAKYVGLAQSARSASPSSSSGSISLAGDIGGGSISPSQIDSVTAVSDVGAETARRGLQNDEFNQAQSNAGSLTVNFFGPVLGRAQLEEDMADIMRSASDRDLIAVDTNGRLV